MTADRAGGIALALLAAGVLWASRPLPLGTPGQPGPAAFPVGLALLLLLAGATLAWRGAAGPRLAALGWSEGRHALAILLVGAVAAVALERLGYRLTMTLAVLVLVGLVERRGPVVTAAVALGLAFGSFWVFHTLLRTPLPRGPFGL